MKNVIHMLLIFHKWSHHCCGFRLYVGCATVGAFIGHYRSQGISLKQLSSWSKCGSTWLPPDGTTCDTLFRSSGREFPQTLSLTVLVCIELFKALSAVSVDSSLFTIGPNKNPMLVLGVAAPFLIHVFLLYSSELGFSGLAKSFGLVRLFLFWDYKHMFMLYFRTNPFFQVPLSLRDWTTVFKWSAPILLVEEALKAIGRRRKL